MTGASRGIGYELAKQFAGHDYDLLMGSARTKLQGAASKVMPDKLKAEMHRRMAEPGSGHNQ
ncbi:MAG: hypothetical protein SYR96_31755 [Actinomycetota bacterium]|nr:hypothetical protein [Actinomycetota bacterium]